MSLRGPSGFTDIKKPNVLHHPVQDKNLYSIWYVSFLIYSNVLAKTSVAEMSEHRFNTLFSCFGQDFIVLLLPANIEINIPQVNIAQGFSSIVHKLAPFI